MKQTKIIMGMPVTVEIIGEKITRDIFKKVFAYFRDIDARFSTYKKTSEISLINQGKVTSKEYSPDMKEIFRLAEETKWQTNGYFDIFFRGKYDPSGIVKGWAIRNAAEIIKKAGYQNFYVDAGSDIQTLGKNNSGTGWKVGIKNPFKQREIVKVLALSGEGIATSGNYIRGDHIYNPLSKKGKLDEIVSLTVIGPNVYEADRLATAGFAMGEIGINFIENLPKFEGYMIDKEGVATITSGFQKYVVSN